MQESAAMRWSARLVAWCGLVVVLLVASAPDARAQVNAETLRAQLRETPKFLWIDGALASRTGNSPGFSVSAGLFAGYTAAPHLFFAKATAEYGTTIDQELIVAKSLLHLRYNYMTTRFLFLEVLAQVQNDHFRRIAVRDLYGTGLRFNWIREKDFELFHGNTILLEQQSVTAQDDYPSSNAVYVRLSNYLGVNANLWDIGTLTTVTYIQPRFLKPKDFRLLSETNITFSITKRLAAKFSFNVTYDREPPAGVLPLDLEVKNSLAVKF
ncbi:MAG: putative outer membrane protein [Labilithrix sp.]|nr:putative outer membrane protein [Labilithrix sp.]